MISIPCRTRVAMATKKKFLKKTLKNCWADLKIIWPGSKWSLGDPLPRLFKLYCSVEEYGCQGTGPVFPLGKSLKILSKTAGLI